MLELRPSCEQCNKALPPNSTEAMICSYECTFCAECAKSVLEDVCPNCGGGFCLRPIRPSHNLKNKNYLGNDSAITQVTYKPVDVVAHRLFAERIKQKPPHQR